MSYATAALATYANMLGTLDHLVTKAESHEKGDALLQANQTCEFDIVLTFAGLSLERNPSDRSQRKRALAVLTIRRECDGVLAAEARITESIA